ARSAIDTSSVFTADSGIVTRGKHNPLHRAASLNQSLNQSWNGAPPELSGSQQQLPDDATVLSGQTGTVVTASRLGPGSTRYTAGSVRAPSRATTGSLYRRKRERMFKILSGLLIAFGSIIAIFEIFALGFKRDYQVYGSGIWVGLPIIALAGLTLASIGRGRQFNIALLVCAALLLPVLAAGLAISGYELNLAMVKLYDMQSKQGGSTNDCGSCGELVMTKCSFAIVLFVVSVVFVCLIIYRLSVKLCACCKPSPEELKRNALTQSAIDQHNQSLRGSKPPSVYAPSVRSYAQSQISQSVPDLYPPRAPSQSASQYLYDPRASGAPPMPPPQPQQQPPQPQRQPMPQAKPRSSVATSSLADLPLSRNQPPPAPKPPPPPQALQAQPILTSKPQNRKPQQQAQQQQRPPPQQLASQRVSRPTSGYRQRSSSGKRVPRN
ncbi:hypothetical protein BOX15_Mlig031507g2, partial [Macrostomum lignano]